MKTPHNILIGQYYENTINTDESFTITDISVHYDYIDSTWEPVITYHVNHLDIDHNVSLKHFTRRLSDSDFTYQLK